ncbi:MAG: hypothetical protein KBA95_15990 [Acidobacteria bacterium]|nr:hypothetical protein [Acidobacteriota bacterium]
MKHTDEPMPRTRGDCPPHPVPCPFLECRHHLWFDRVVENGRVVHVHMTRLHGVESRTCSLRFAERGPLTLDQVGRVLGVTRERVRQIEAEALRRLCEADDGTLREFLIGLGDEDDRGETWSDENDTDLRADAATDPGEGDDGAAIDGTGVPEGFDEFVSDDTGVLPWSEPTSTDPTVLAVNQRRIERALALAAGAPEYRCPYCKRAFPGVCIDGRERRGCPDPRCAGHAWGDRAREQGRHRLEIPPEVIAAIRAEYRPGERGYRALAHAHGLPVGTVAKVLRGDRRGEG